MRVFSKLKFFIITLALVLLFGNIGLGAYIVGSKNASVEGNVSINSVGDAVCEIGSTKYTSIEKALAVAYSTNGSQTIRVLPGVNGYTITKPCTLGSGDSLLIPYDDTCSLKNPTADVEISGFADNNPDTYRKTLVVLSSTLTIESGAKLVICGKTGGSDPQGATTGDYAELQFTSSGYIDCSGDITCYGYIHDQAEKQRAVDDICIYMHSGIVEEPLVMYDWGSASTAQGKMNYAFPINHFDFPNIRPPMYFEYGSKMVALGHIYGSNILVGHKKANGTIVATDAEEAFLQLKTGSGVLINANNVDELKTGKNPDQHSIQVRASGNLNISAVVVSLSGYKLDSKKYYLPISGIYEVVMVSGSCNFNYDTKFLPGSSLTINHGASVEFVKNVVFYKSTTSLNGLSMPDSWTFTKPAKLINNGILTIDSGFEGDVQTIRSDSLLAVKSSYTTVYNCYEATKNEKIGPFYFGGARGLIAKDASGKEMISDAGFGSGVTYHSSNNFWYHAPGSSFNFDFVVIRNLTTGQLSTDAGKSKEFTLTVLISPSAVDVKTIIWKVETQKEDKDCNVKDATFKNEINNEKQIIVVIPANNESKHGGFLGIGAKKHDCNYLVTVMVTDANNVSKSHQITLTAKVG